MMTYRENYLRTMEFRNPEWIPCSAGFSAATWKEHRERLEEIVLRHPLIFPGHKKGGRNFDECPAAYKTGYHRDNWGCLWHIVQEGLEGQVVEHPLADYSALDTYQPPDILARDWEQARRSVEEQRNKGLLTRGSGERLFDRLYFLRGFENLMMDIASDAPDLSRLMDMFTEYKLRLVHKWLEIGVDIMGFHTDIGTQKALMISPAKFRKYIKPMFRELFMACRNAGSHVALSSDGRLLEIVDDLVECGVSMHDPQLRANTLEGIAKAYKGRMCINLDLDRQMFAFCKPEDIRTQIREAVRTLGSREGGLLVFGSVSGANVSLENIEALCAGLEEYMYHWA